MRSDGGRTATEAISDALGSADASGLFVGNPDRYEHQGEHARGGLGRIVKAEDRSLLRVVAIKELLHESPTAAARFMREALITARLEHPGIVPIYEAGRWPTGGPYYTMRLVSGRTLKEVVRSHESLQERLSLLSNVIAVAETIAYAHSEGVLHRDVKPSNVVIGDYGETVVIDWGLAKDLCRPEEEELPPALSGVSGEHTAMGDVLGTPAYMPPEQARGEEVDERADVYSLGAMLYEVLASRPPYAGVESDEIISHVLDGPPEPLDRLVPDVPPDLLAIVCKAMSRDPDARYATAKTLADDLKRYQTGQLVSAHSYKLSTIVKRWLWKHRGAVGVAAVFLVALAIGGVVAVNRVVEEKNLANAQRAEAQERGHELVLLQARTNMDRDPTAAIAWLKDYPLDGGFARRAQTMMDEARSRGVARHVFRTGDAVRDVAFSPDGEWLAPASKDGIARIFSLASGEERVLGGQKGGIWSLAFSPDGKYLATGGVFGTVMVWDLADGSSRTLGSHRAPVTRLVFSRDGSRLLSADEKGGGRAWEIDSGEQLASSRGAGAGDVAGDGSAVAVAESLGKLWVYDLESSKRRQLTTLSSGATRLRMSPDGTRIVIHTKDGKLQVADVAAGAVRDLGVRKGFIFGIEFSPDGKRVATAGVNGVAEVWDLDTGESTILRGHQDAIYMAVFSPDGDTLVTAGDDGTARVWSLTTGNVHVLRGHEDDVLRVLFSPDGSMVATGSMDGSVRVWPLDFDDSRAFVAQEEGSSGIRAPRIGWGMSEGIGHLALASDDRTLITHAGDGEIRRWDLETGESRVVGQSAEPRPGIVPERPPISPDGKFIATRGKDFSVDLWNTDTGERRSLRGHEGDVTAAGFTSDSRYLGTAGRDGNAFLWETRGTGSRKLELGEPVISADFAKDDSRLAVMTEKRVVIYDLKTLREERSVSLPEEEDGIHDQGMVRLAPDGSWALVQRLGVRAFRWDLTTGEKQDFDSPELAASMVTISPDGRWLAAGANSRHVYVWDMQRGQGRHLEGHTDLVFQMRFSPDSKRLASVSYDRTVRLWDLATGEARVLRGHAGGVASVAFASDGSFLVTAGDDDTVRVWKLGKEPSYDVASVRERLDRMTTAVIGEDNRPTSPTR